MSLNKTAHQSYQLWLDDELIDDTTKEELRAIANQSDEIEDRFYRELEFGTGGLRGVIGAGINRMNRYTIGKATQGLAEYVLRTRRASTKESSETTPSTKASASSEAASAVDASTPKAVIAYDSRNQSPEFALEAALVLAGNGIQAHVFTSLRPTPELSFAVRALNASAGIVITASHNPPEYNGYKVYGNDGGQLVTEAANQVTDLIRGLTELSQIKKLSQAEAEAANLLCWLGEDMDEQYIREVTAMSLNTPINPSFNQELSIVFTPLHGTGNLPIRKALKQIGCTNVSIVKQQELPDANFSTVASPNPEERAAFTLALQLAEEKQADIIVGTDPDADRMGAVVRNHQGDFEVLSGNQTGALLTHYIISRLKEQNKLPANGVLIKTIVTSELGAQIAKSFGISTINTLTGFKYIGELMTKFAQTKEKQFLFGYEESYGYLAGTYARDKDAVIAAMLICEAAAYYKQQGQSLYEILEQIYDTHGYYLEKLQSKTFKGKSGVEQIGKIMQAFRDQAPVSVHGLEVTECKDYLKGMEGLPKENVLKYILQDGSWFCLRPSGTEPKIKIYFGVVTPSLEQSQKQMEHIMHDVMHRIDAM